MLLVLAGLAVLGVLTGGGVALWALLGGDDDPVATPAEPAPPAPPPPTTDEPPVPEPDEPSAPDEPAPPPAEPPEPDDPPLTDDPSGPAPPANDGPRSEPVPWISFVLPGDGWRFTEIGSPGSPAFDGRQDPDGYLEVFVDDGYLSIEEVLTEIEIDAAEFGAEPIGRDELEIPGADRAVSLLYSIPDPTDPYDQGVLLLETGEGRQPLIVVMVMFSEGMGPTLFDITDTFATVILDREALTAAMGG